MTTANVDANGQTLFIGDEIVCRGKVKDVRDGHVLVDCVHAPVREFWFVTTQTERTAQGAASLGADTQSKAAAAPPAPTPIAQAPANENANNLAQTVADPNSPREKAIAHVMSHNYDRPAAEKIVEEQGTATILADLETESAQKADNEPPKTA